MKDEAKQKAIVEATLKAYEIPPQWVFASRYDEQTDTVIIVTHGGKKIVHKVGAAIERKLTMVEISGFLPKEEMFWSEALNQRVRLSELRKGK
ncbi:MAG: hypothetical protein AB2L12_16930 [Smithellaceae bacterium]